MLQYIQMQADTTCFICLYFKSQYMQIKRVCIQIQAVHICLYQCSNILRGCCGRSWATGASPTRRIGRDWARERIGALLGKARHHKQAEGGLSAVEAFARMGRLNEASTAARAAPRGCGPAVYRHAGPGAQCRAVLQPAAAAAGARGAH